MSEDLESASRTDAQKLAWTIFDRIIVGHLAPDIPEYNKVLQGVLCLMTSSHHSGLSEVSFATDHQ
ncbi:MAG: hypothetical protein MPJ22_05905 [Pirellulales bacterium]|nr:hypothetical protein [Pirellulales bacterium]